MRGAAQSVENDDAGRLWEMTHVADPDAASVGTGVLAGNGDTLACALLATCPTARSASCRWRSPMTPATPLSSHDSSVLVTGDEVCVVAEAGEVDELQCSADDGRTWAPRPLPGFR